MFKFITKKSLTTFILISIILGGFSVAQNSEAAIKKQFNYQGKLTDANGVAVADGLYDITFKLYDDLSDVTADWTETWDTALWTETAVWTSIVADSPSAGLSRITYVTSANDTTLKAGQTLWNTTRKESALIYAVDTGNSRIDIQTPFSTWATTDDLTNRIYVRNGLFSVMVGSVTDQTIEFTSANADYYLGVAVGADVEMKPRKKIGAVPFAWNANSVVGDGYIDLDNTSVDQDAVNINYNPASGTNNALDITYGSGGGTGTALTVTQSGTGDIINLTGDAITTGTGLAMSVDGLTTGMGLDLTSTSAAGAGGGNTKLLNLVRSGANTNASHTAYGLYSAVTNTGTTSTNIGGYFSASGATNNYAAIFENGYVGIGITTPSASLHVAGQCVTADSRLRRRRRKRKGEKADPEKDEWEDEEYIYDEVMIKDIRPGDEIASMDPITGELVYSQVRGLMDMGIKEIYQLTTQSGRQIRTTGNHPYFVRTKYEKDEVAKQNQKLYRFEVDQSIRIENFNKDSIIAVANNENSQTITLSRKVKRELRDCLRQYSQPRKLNATIFASAIVVALENMDARVHELVIDTEYIGYENVITNIILSKFANIEISFTQIGRQSPAHHSAYEVHRKRCAADVIATVDTIIGQTKNALRTASLTRRSASLSSPQASLITNSIDDNKNLVKEGRCHSLHRAVAPQMQGLQKLAKSGQWTKVKDLKAGRMIAVTHGDKVVWERITKIKKQAAEKVYDIEVQGTHNFIANGIVAHNTYLNTNSATALKVEDSGGNTDVLVVDTANGRVGIGTAAPGATLHVEGQCVTGDTMLPIMANQKTPQNNAEFLERGGEQGSRTLYQKGTCCLSDTDASTGALLSSDRHKYNYNINNNSNQNKNTSIENEDAFFGAFGIKVPVSDNYRYCSTSENLVNPISNYEIEYIPIKNVQPGMEVLSLNEKTGELEPARINGLMDMGVKPIYKLMTESGKSIRTTGNHPYLAKSDNLSNAKWTKVYRLNEGDEIAVADYFCAVSTTVSAKYEGGTGVTFEKIVSIKILSPEQVYDIEVEGTHNFVANGIIAHNTYLNGNVGIGTVTPSEKLTIQQDAAGNLISLDDGANNAVFTVNDGGIATFKPTAFDYVYNDDGTPTYIDHTTEAKTTAGTAFEMLELEASSTDEFYVGLDHPFDTVYFDIATAGAGVTLSAQYYVAAWTALTITDNTTNLTVDGTVTFTAPSNWAATAINGQTKYWVRFRSPATNITTAPTAYSVSPTTGNRFYVYAQAGDTNAAFYINDKGSVGIGTITPEVGLHIGTGSPSSLTANNDDLFVTGELEVGETAYLGPMEFGADSGAISWIDMPVTSGASVDTVESYTARIDGVSLLTIYAESDGAGGIQDSGVGIGTVTPTAKLTVAQSGTGDIVDFKNSSTSLFTLIDEDRLKLEGNLATSIGNFNDNLIDDMESAEEAEWVESETGVTDVVTETAKIKANDGAMKITTTASSSDTDYLRKTISSEDWSGNDRIGFWIQGTETGQIISIQFYDTGAVTSDHNITIQSANEWQYEEWDISGITSTSRDVVSWIQFIIDDDTDSPTFYIDQLRRYNNSSATNRMAEYFLDADGKLVIVGDQGVEIWRTASGSSLPAMSFGAATVEIKNPLDLQVEGDVGIEYNLEFLNNGTSYINSAGPLVISAGDSNSYENLTLTTSGTGDIVMDIADSAIGFKIIGTTTAIFAIDASGDVTIGGVNATDSDLVVKRNISTQGGNLTIAKLDITSAGTPSTSVATSGGSCLSATTYYYRIVAVNGNGETDVDDATSGSQATGDAGDNEVVTVLWDAVSGATGYKVYRDTDDDWTDGADSLVDSGAISSPTISVVDNCAGDLAAQTPSSINTTGGDITGILSFSDATELTVASGVITATQTYHRIDTESDGATDDLNTISGGTEGDILVLRAENAARTVVVKDGGGNIQTAGDMSLDNSQDTIVLVYDGSNWLEISRADSGADIAESYYTDDLSIEAGDVVKITKLDETFLNEEEKLRAHKYPAIAKTLERYDSGTIGVVSTAPNMTLGGGNDKLSSGAETRPVVLSGRVPVKVSLENGNIEVGDFLTSSDIPGVAAKATGSGIVIGRALESFDGNVMECNVSFVKKSEEEIENLNPGEDDTIKLTECQTVPSEIGKVMTFINVGWQGGNNEGQEWLEVNGWCISIDEAGEWKRVKKTAPTCRESADSVIISEPADIPIPLEPEPIPTAANRSQESVELETSTLS